MKQSKLVVLSLLALFSGRWAGLRTANTVAENEADIASLKEQLAAQQEELKVLRAASSAPVTAVALPTATDLLIKGAGVEANDVAWRIRAGLEPHQAVEVAAAEKAEREAAEQKGGQK